MYHSKTNLCMALGKQKTSRFTTGGKTTMKKEMPKPKINLRFLP